MQSVRLGLINLSERTLRIMNGLCESERFYMRAKSREELEKIAKQIRIDIVDMTHSSGQKGAHLGGSMSIADIVAVLYGSVMNVDPANPEMDERDRLIISKAHAAMTLYAGLSSAGFISREEIANAMHGESKFFEHPKKNPEYGIELSGGSLGQGLSFAMGMGLGLKRKGNNKSRVFVILGDGECDEGSIWEAATAIHHYGLENIIIIVDQNGLQYDGTCDEILTIGSSMKARWESLGYEVTEVDGHDVMALQDELGREHKVPSVLICKTVKGRGVSFAENAVEWHTGRVTDELYEIAMKDLNA